MGWLRALLARLSSRTEQAQQRVDEIEQTLAALRAKVQALPPEERGAFLDDIQALLKEQARARNALDDALDDRRNRQNH